MKHIIEIPEITRVEGHSAVVVNMSDGKVESVQLDVFEGTRFFEKIVVGHKHYELPHITSRVCAICSAGHVLAAINSIERGLQFEPTPLLRAFRELMHLGMIVESHSTHLFALVLPDYVGVHDLVQFATEQPTQFKHWNVLRKLGSTLQTIIGGRPFHPVNLQVGGLSKYPTNEDLAQLLPMLQAALPLAIDIAEHMISFDAPVKRSTTPVFLALEPGEEYGYFGDTVLTSDGERMSIAQYQDYLAEVTVGYSHAKRSTFSGKSFMVGSMARMHLFHQLLTGDAARLYTASPLASGDRNTLCNNIAQSIELVEAIQQCQRLIARIEDMHTGEIHPNLHVQPVAGKTVGAVECPRGTLYHSYTFDENGTVTAADMITPSAQNTARIERDIYEVVENNTTLPEDEMRQRLETLIRAYDPCNTCATHMVQIRYA